MFVSLLWWLGLWVNRIWSRCSIKALESNIALLILLIGRWHGTDWWSVNWSHFMAWIWLRWCHCSATCADLGAYHSLHLSWGLRNRHAWSEFGFVLDQLFSGNLIELFIIFWNLNVRLHLLLLWFFMSIQIKIVINKVIWSRLLVIMHLELAGISYLID